MALPSHYSESLAKTFKSPLMEPMIRIDCRGVSGDDFANSEQIRFAYDCFVKNGYAILDHVLSQDKVRDLNIEFNDRYAKYLRDHEFEDTLKVGNRRFIVPIDFSGGFRDPLVYANPYVVALVREAFDQDAILDSFGVIVSLSGSKSQHVHRDGALLFDSTLSPLLPPYALTCVLPLIEMNDAHGTTAIWPGSHRWKSYDDQVPSDSANIPIGSCVLWDFRLFHGGTANRSNQHRPSVYGTYARSWYRDSNNFEKATQRRLSFDRDFIQSVPEGCRSLFSHVQSESVIC